MNQVLQLTQSVHAVAGIPMRAIKASICSFDQPLSPSRPAPLPATRPRPTGSSCRRWSRSPRVPATPRTGSVHRAAQAPKRCESTESPGLSLPAAGKSRQSPPRGLRCHRKTAVSSSADKTPPAGYPALRGKTALKGNNEGTMVYSQFSQ